ncbi:MAG: polyamine aminopropyltransferase [Candidatus Magnetobacterium sp. LHC-1]|uniref:Polyamine aminopropyltransferase n=1 Tax=Candidatus Magnetobacterium casense TaxID=1455061 RepID=A0ABS6S207_9BACT|nr:polyamine aminopropyltransferase [Candidatus Magnetobacterium casensis]MBF0606868.1 polyamine aminopropyltransferase [Nitrospirota bacterium]MBV6342887.1 polyamine aminopropyltransferase [Candidatus Magnetobacterium casensis]
MIKFIEQEPYSAIVHTYDVEGILYKGKSKYQEIMVIENPFFGRMLLLDNIVQITQRDEFFYHEMLTHVGMYAHPNPSRVVVIGGGDGGIVREVLKHKGVEKVYFVEIDEMVISVSKKYFPDVAVAVDDPRVEIKTMDGAEFIKGISNIDMVIVDSTDIIGFARTLFTKEFFQAVSDCMGREGIFVTHTESLHLHKDIVIEMQEELRGVFPVVDLYTAAIVTYPGNWWAFAVGSKELNPRQCRRPFDIDTKYYDQEIHTQAFLTPGFYKKLLNRQLQW